MKFLIITSIFSPTKAVKKFANKKDWKVVVVGDKKTPTDWELPGVIYLNLEMQEKLFPLFRLPYNIYARKMYGYLYAMSMGASVIADSDDDNIPHDDWGNDLDIFATNNRKLLVNTDYSWINIYEYFSDIKPLWPRGFPLDLIKKNNKKDLLNFSTISNIGIVQQLADGDPDVDAIYRLTNNKEIIFDKNQVGIVIDSNGICPINSQNTFFRSDVYRLMYLPVLVNFRVTDILRGYVATIICNFIGINVAFDTASVFQDRNEHDYLKDFESELPLYKNIKELPKILTEDLYNAGFSSSSKLQDLIYFVYSSLEKFGWIPMEELTLLKIWLNYCNELDKKGSHN